MSEPISDDELLALADAATAGEWRVWCHAAQPYADCELRDSESGYVARAAHDNAAFIAASREAVPRLIAEKRALVKRVARAEGRIASASSILMGNGSPLGVLSKSELSMRVAKGIGALTDECGCADDRAAEIQGK